LLLAPEHEQFGVGGEDLPEGVLKLAAGLDAALDLLGPGGRDSFDALLAAGHKGQEPDGVALLLSTVASGLAAAAVGQAERAGQQIIREVEPADQFKLALAEARGLGPLGSNLICMVLYIQKNGNASACLGLRKQEAPRLLLQGQAYR